jgi:RND family efflux transporter MFP subunit
MNKFRTLNGKNMFSKIFKQITQHKFITGVIIILIIAGAYFGYAKIFKNNGAVRYATAQVQKGTLIVSVSGSGHVSVSNQIDIKPKVSGDIVYVGVKNGQEVKAGTLIAQLDARDAQKAVRDAEINLESAKLSLEKLKQPADTLSILQAENALKLAEQELEKLQKPPDTLELLQAENSLAQAKESKQKAEDDLKKAYDDGFNTVANAFLDLPTIMAGLHDILFNNDFNSSQENLSYYANAVKYYDDRALQYKDDAYNSYQTSRAAYNKNFADYKTITRYSEPATIEGLINETYDTTKAIAEAVKSANNLIQFYQDKLTERNLKPAALSDTHLSILNTYTGKTNTHLLNLLGIKNTIKNSRDTIVNSDRLIAEKTELLNKLKAGADPKDIQTAQDKIREKQEALLKLKAGADALDIQSAELTVKQRENALLDAKEKLADYYVRAPFDGIIAKINVKKGDSVSSASILATLITRQKLAEISLNEVDVAKVKVGQKATLTFDAVPDLTITGQVAEVDAVGTVSQGVVTYTVKIGFDTQDDRVKPGMSVSATIVTEAKPNVLLVPNSAIKSQGGMSYVEIVEGDDRNTALNANAHGVILKNTPRRQPIEIGLANDGFTEVTSGLKEGDVIVTRTIQPTTAQTKQKQQQSGGLRIPGFPGGGGGGFRR